MIKSVYCASESLKEENIAIQRAGLKQYARFSCTSCASLLVKVMWYVLVGLGGSVVKQVIVCHLVYLP